MNSERTEPASSLHVVDLWTGQHAVALRVALRMTTEEFAEKLGTAVRTVSKWNGEPGIVPGTEYQRVLDTALSKATKDEQLRFHLLMEQKAVDSQPTMTEPEVKHLRVQHEPVIQQCFDWIDDAAGWPTGQARTQVELLLGGDEPDMTPRAPVSTNELVAALTSYYKAVPEGYLPFEATHNNDRLQTGILTRPEWVNVALPLGVGRDTLKLDPASNFPQIRLNSSQAKAAVSRIAKAITAGTNIVNAPLYSMTNVELSRAALTGTLKVTDFLSYALTMDLLESELLAALADPSQTKLSLPLRDQYLPTASSVTRIAERLCAGGVATLFAAKRPPTKLRKEADYAILVQERSAAVINAVGRMAVIPKGCHQPLADFSDDAQVSATLERELEEELFSRQDIDSTYNTNHLADPLHISRLSQPLKWLIANTDSSAWTSECTGLGLNLLSGNFEFACLVAIHDERWWQEFGGQIESNWESAKLQCYSTANRDTLNELIGSHTWGNEDLFSLVLGLLRLNELNGSNVQLPDLQLSPNLSM